MVQVLQARQVLQALQVFQEHPSPIVGLLIWLLLIV